MSCYVVLDWQGILPGACTFVRCGSAACGGLLSGATGVCTGICRSSGFASLLKVRSAACSQNLLAASFLLGVGACICLGIAGSTEPALDAGMAGALSAPEAPMAFLGPPTFPPAFPTGLAGGRALEAAACQKFMAAAAMGGGRALGRAAGAGAPAAGAGVPVAGCKAAGSAAGGVAARWLS